MNRTRCLVCEAPLMEKPLLKCNSMPRSAQHFPDKDNLYKDEPISLNLMQCSGCGLIQLDTDAVDYYRDVIRSGGYSTTMHALRHEEYERFLEICPLKGKKIIEVGCGQGEFLRIWREDGFSIEAYGIENNAELVRIAQQDELHVERNFAENEGTKFAGGPFDGFCSFNFIEHQPNPNGMLRSIYYNLKEEAYGLITVPAWEYILAQESYYELIRDHIAYYSKDSFRFLLEKNGFSVLSMREVNRDTWEAIVQKKQRADTTLLQNNMFNLINEIEKMTERLKNEGKRLALWGASHQGLTILASTKLKDTISYVIDSAPFKQGLYTIGSRIKIVSPSHLLENPVQVILIIAPGYTDEISKTIKLYDAGSIEIYALRGNKIESI